MSEWNWDSDMGIIRASLYGSCISSSQVRKQMTRAISCKKLIINATKQKRLWFENKNYIIKTNIINADEPCPFAQIQ